jgi:hypothetical protein
MIRKSLLFALVFYVYCLAVYKEPKDQDFVIDQKPVTVPDLNLNNPHVFIPKDTTPYKGNWVDVQQ